MSHHSTNVCTSGAGSNRIAGNLFWLDRRSFSVVVTSLASLMNSMSIAFSPFTASMFMTYDDTCLVFTEPLPKLVGSLDRNTTSGDLSASGVEESIHQVIAHPKNTCKEQGSIFSASTFIKAITTLIISQHPISVVSFEGHLVTEPLQKPPKRMRIDSIMSETSKGINYDGYDDSGDDDDHHQRPNKRARLAKSIPESRSEMPSSIGVSRKLKKPTRQWMKFYKNLVAYKEKHNGSTAVPRSHHKNIRLGVWVHRQRCKFRKNQLSMVEINLLESIGFSRDNEEEHKDYISVRSSARGNYGRDIRQLSSWAKEERWKIRPKTLSKNRANLLPFER